MRKCRFSFQFSFETMEDFCLLRGFRWQGVWLHFEELGKTLETFDNNNKNPFMYLGGILNQARYNEPQWQMLPTNNCTELRNSKGNDVEFHWSRNFTSRRGGILLKLEGSSVYDGKLQHNMTCTIFNICWNDYGKHTSSQQIWTRIGL